MFLEASYRTELVVIVLERNFARDVTTTRPAATDKHTPTQNNLLIL